MSEKLTDSAVLAFVTALNAGDRTAFRAALTDDAAMSDDGTERDLEDWTEREIFSSQGHLDTDSLESVADGGRSFVTTYSNATWGGMRTRWHFVVRDGKIARFETGQA
jgi:hypothetical protein